MGIFGFFKKNQKKESATSTEDKVTQKELQISKNDEAKTGTKSFEDAFMDIQIGSNYSLIHEVNKYLEDGKKVDVSGQMQVLLLGTGNKDLRKLSDLCKEHGRECPSEMWLVYDAG